MLLHRLLPDSCHLITLTVSAAVFSEADGIGGKDAALSRKAARVLKAKKKGYKVAGGQGL